MDVFDFRGAAALTASSRASAHGCHVSDRGALCRLAARTGGGASRSPAETRRHRRRRAVADRVAAAPPPAPSRPPSRWPRRRSSRPAALGRLPTTRFHAHHRGSALGAIGQRPSDVLPRASSYTAEPRVAVGRRRRCSVARRRRRGPRRVRASVDDAPGGRARDGAPRRPTVAGRQSRPPRPRLARSISSTVELGATWTSASAISDGIAATRRSERRRALGRGRATAARPPRPVTGDHQRHAGRRRAGEDVGRGRRRRCRSASSPHSSEGAGRRLGAAGGGAEHRRRAMARRARCRARAERRRRRSSLAVQTGQRATYRRRPTHAPRRTRGATL